MPLLYGEGPKAFIRLQEEILKETGDESLFAWKACDDSIPYRGLFADSPSEFKDSRNIVRLWDRINEATITSGIVMLRSSVQSIKVEHTTSGTVKTHLNSLRCTLRGNGIDTIAIEICGIYDEPRWFRSSPNKLFQMSPVLGSSPCYVLKSAHEFSLKETRTIPNERYGGFYLGKLPAKFQVERLIPDSVIWRSQQNMIYRRSLVNGRAGIVVSTPSSNPSKRMLIILWGNPNIDHDISQDCRADALFVHKDQVDEIYSQRTVRPVKQGSPVLQLPPDKDDLVRLFIGAIRVQTSDMCLISIERQNGSSFTEPTASYRRYNRPKHDYLGA